MLEIDKLKNVFIKNNVSFSEDENELVLEYPYLIADKTNLVLKIKTAEKMIEISDDGVFLNLHNNISEKSLNIFKKNNIVVLNGVLNYKCKLDLAYFEIEKFVQSITEADLIENGDL